MKMKTIGLLGGTSWPSTTDYYRYLNELAQKHLGGFHSANLILRSIDYHAIRSHYPSGWDKITPLLKEEVMRLVAMKPDCIMVCNNTLHQALDRFLGEIPLPVIHIVQAAAARAKALGLKSLLLLATKPTMQDGYYKSKLEEAGFTVTIPTDSECDEVQKMQSEMAKGVMKPEFRAGFKKILDDYAHLDGVVLGCTELPLAIGADETKLALIDTLRIQCEAAFDFALAKPEEFGGPKGKEPTRYNDWEIGGKAVDF